MMILVGHSLSLPLFFIWIKVVDPGKPPQLTWQRKLNNHANANVPSEFTLSFKEMIHLVRNSFIHSFSYIHTYIHLQLFFYFLYRLPLVIVYGAMFVKKLPKEGYLILDLLFTK